MELKTSLKFIAVHPNKSTMLWLRMKMLMGFLRRFDDCPITNNTIMLPAIPTNRGLNNPVNIITSYFTAVF